MTMTHPHPKIARYFVALCLIMLAPSIFADEKSKAGDYRFTHIARGNEDRMYGLSFDRGALVSMDRGKSWSHRSEGLPRKQVWPFKGEIFRQFTSLAVAPHDRDRVAATTSSDLFLLDEEGARWRKIDLRYPVRSSNYLTAVCFDPDKESRIYLGTSFNGIFISDDNGRSWEKISQGLSPLYRGAGFYEEISDLAMSPALPGTLFIASAFENRIYRYHLQTHELETVELPTEGGSLHSINHYAGSSSEEPALEVHFQDSRFIYGLDTGDWRELPPLRRSAASFFGSPQSEPDTDNEALKAIYLNAYNARGQRLQRHLEFLKEHGFNAIVVDLKDDSGRLTYESELELPRKIGAVHPVLSLSELVEEAHKQGVSIIGRMVVFKDKLLYEMEGQPYAIWDRSSDRPWAHKVAEEREGENGESETVMVQREYWNDPFAEGVWDYNIAIAEELERFGVDEVQFDYIRFPSDGDLSTATYRYRRPGMLRTEAIESFIKKARSRLSLPISVDLYGFNSWYRMGNWIGQDIGMLSRYVDVICPMYYPSHFPYDFLRNDNYIHRAYDLYTIGTERARKITEDRSQIRPYVQAFLMGHELSMEEQEYNRYLNRQLEGLIEAGGCGYTLWNNMNRYYMVNERVAELNGVHADKCRYERTGVPDS